MTQPNLQCVCSSRILMVLPFIIQDLQILEKLLLEYYNHGSSLYIRGFKFRDQSPGNSAYVVQVGCHQEEALQHPRWLDHLKAGF